MLVLLYTAVKKLAAVFFNVLNLFLGGNLPPFTCVCVIVEEQGRFLVIERPHGQVVFPAGFMRWREQPERAALREGKEETGLDLRIGEMIAYYPLISHGLTSMSTISLVFHAELVGGELRNSIEGQPQWLDEPTLRTKLNPYARHLLDTYQRYRERLQPANVSSL